MPSLVVPNSALVKLVWGSATGNVSVNVIGYSKAAGFTIDQSVADAVKARIHTVFATSGLQPLIPTGLGLNTVSIRDISSPNLPEFTGAGARIAGTAAAGKILPPQVAVCVTLRTARAGKSYRGRVYLGSWHDSVLDASGAATAAATTAAQSFIDLIRQNAGNASLGLAIVSRKLLTNTPVTLVQVRDATFDTIRGRAVPGV